MKFQHWKAFGVSLIPEKSRLMLQGVNTLVSSFSKEDKKTGTCNLSFFKF